MKTYPANYYSSDLHNRVWYALKRSKADPLMGLAARIVLNKIRDGQETTQEEHDLINKILRDGEGD